MMKNFIMTILKINARSAIHESQTQFMKFLISIHAVRQFIDFIFDEIILT